MSSDKIGVYICQCGGNISDHVDVDEVVAAVEKEQGVTVAKTAMFTCSDATQSEIIADAQEQGLDGLVIASCSPKLHTFTFRDVAKRAGMNPFQYTQVNVREQCSWTHTDDHEGATEKAVRLVRAGINRTRLTDPLEPIVVETTPKSLVVGGGIAGLRAALGLAEVGLSVFLVEKEAKLGGWVAGFREMFPHGRNGRELIAKLEAKVRSHPAITVFTSAELVAKSGSFGNYEATVAVKNGDKLETITVDVGSIVIATGFDTYQPEEGELGYGIDGVITIADFKKLLDETDGPLAYNGKPVKTVAYIYCVGSRQDESVEGANTYCSRYCCTAAVHAATQVDARPARVHQYHFYRDMRTYGKYELLYAEALEKGSAFVKFPDDEPPAVEKDAKSGGVTVTARDLLSEGEEVALTADLVVLVTGMVPRENEGLTKRSSSRSARPASTTRSTPSSARSRRSWTAPTSAAPARAPGPRRRPSPPVSPRWPRARRSSSAGTPSSTRWSRPWTPRPAPGAAPASSPVPTTRSPRSRRAARRSPPSPRRRAKAAAAASPSARRTPSTCRATPTPRSGP